MGNKESTSSNIQTETWKIKESCGSYCIRVYSGPGFQYPEVSVLGIGEHFTVYERSGDWLKCEDGWVSRYSQNGDEVAKFKHNDTEEKDFTARQKEKRMTEKENYQLQHVVQHCKIENIECCEGDKYVPRRDHRDNYVCQGCTNNLSYLKQANNE